MAAYGWRQTATVEEGLFEEAHRFDFFQAVKLLEMIYEGWQPVAAEQRPERRLVLFKSNPGLAFAASDIEEIKAPPKVEGAEVEGPDAEGRNPKGPVSMTVNFMGLAGTGGPLPSTFSETVAERAGRNDFALRDFLDLFNHRLIGIAYRARKQSRPSLQVGRPEEGTMAQVLFSVLGLGTPQLQDRMAVKDRGLLGHAGLLARRARSMPGLVGLLEHYFEAPVSIEPFQGQWFELSGDQKTRLGKPGNSQRLGQGFTLGNRAWDQQAGFELAIGPLSFERFCDFFPIPLKPDSESHAFPSLKSLTVFYAGGELCSRARLMLKPSQTPGFTLSDGRQIEGASKSVPGVRLGWTSWLTGVEQSAQGPVTRPFDTIDGQVSVGLEPSSLHRALRNPEAPPSLSESLAPA